MKTPRSIRELFSMPGFVAGTKLQGIYGDRYARLIILKRRKKQPYARAAVIAAEDGMISVFIGYEIFRSRVADLFGI